MDKTFFLNTTFDRRLKNAALTTDAYSQDNVLTGYVIEDETIEETQGFDESSRDIEQ